MTVFERASVPGMVYTLSGEYYMSATFAREMDRLFMQQWLYVGRPSNCPKQAATCWSPLPTKT